jgi:hypothetical protein
MLCEDRRAMVMPFTGLVLDSYFPYTAGGFGDLAWGNVSVGGGSPFVGRAVLGKGAGFTIHGIEIVETGASDAYTLQFNVAGTFVAIVSVNAGESRYIKLELAVQPGQDIRNFRVDALSATGSSLAILHYSIQGT